MRRSDRFNAAVSLPALLASGLLVTITTAGALIGLGLRSGDILVVFRHIGRNVLWDTGADVTVVDRELMTSHPELFTAEGSASGTDASGTTAVTDVGRMTAYRIADVPFASHLVAIADLPEPMEMVLGYPTLCQAIWSMDLPAGRWAVSLRSTAEPIP